MTQNDNGPGLGRNDRETAVVMFSEKVFFFTPQKNTISKETDTYLGKGHFFLLTTFFGRGQNMVRTKKCFFFGPKISRGLDKPRVGQIPFQVVAMDIGYAVHGTCMH